MYGCKIAKIAVSDVIYSIDILYSYIIPPMLESSIFPGTRVIVPFGFTNNRRTGIVMEILPEGENKGLKPILKTVDNSSVLTKEFIDLADFMKKQYFCTYFDAIKSMLPSGMSLKFTEKYFCDVNFTADALNALEKEIFDAVNAEGSLGSDAIKKLFGEEGLKLCKKLVDKGAMHNESLHKNRINDKTVKIVTLFKTYQETGKILEDKKLLEKHRLVLKYLLENKDTSEKELCYMTGVKTGTIKTLVAKGYISLYEEQSFRQPDILTKDEGDMSELFLNDEQQNVFKSIFENTQKGFAVSLLHGVTGSGKTHVFLSLTDEMLKAGKGVIMLVPEISLTSQMVRRFHSRYGEKIAVMHSGLSAGERLDQWNKIKRGLCSIVIGTRSAVFAPLKKLGIIIIDEEQEHTYKSEMTPRYNAKDVAKFRCYSNNALLLLASATPSVESYYNASTGKYQLTELNSRFNAGPLPTVLVVDMREELKNGNMGVISDRLSNEIAYNLKNQEQTILFINRRGFNSHVSCRSCGYVAMCPNCNISLTYHSKNNRLMCHYCGHSIVNTDTCPSCGEKHFKYFGTGTQKIESELEVLFPEARIVRMDADTTTKKSSYNRIISDFEKYKFDILVGTQMVTKGLDFGNVTLAGVIAADQSLYSDDFRANEKTFSLLTQVTGRAGRGEKCGRAVIQTYNPDNKTLNLAFTQDYKAFFDDEIMLRKAVTYPPFCDLCQILFEGENEPAVKNASELFAKALMELLTDKYKEVPVKGYGPCEAIIPKINNKYRHRLLLKCKNNSLFRKLITEMNRIFYEDKRNKGVYISIDINPEMIQ